MFNYCKTDHAQCVNMFPTCKEHATLNAFVDVLQTFCKLQLVIEPCNHIEQQKFCNMILKSIVAY